MLDFEPHKFKNYEINDIKNEKVFSIFDEYLNFLSEKKINFIVGGSLALILQTNKIYRTVGDIDFCIETSFSPYLRKLFKKHNFLNAEFDKQIGKHVFVKNDIFIDFNIIFFPYSYLIKNSIKFYYKNNEINLMSFKNICEAKKVMSKNMSDPTRKQKHYDDIEFYSKFY